MSPGPLRLLRSLTDSMIIGIRAQPAHASMGASASVCGKKVSRDQARAYFGVSYLFRFFSACHNGVGGPWTLRLLRLFSETVCICVKMLFKQHNFVVRPQAHSGGRGSYCCWRALYVAKSVAGFLPQIVMHFVRMRARVHTLSAPTQEIRISFWYRAHS